MTGFDGARLEDTTENKGELTVIVHTITLHVLHVLFLDPFSVVVFAFLVFLCFSLRSPLFTNSAPSVEVPFHRHLSLNRLFR
jgi:hypothetical protein